jgi:hypothetical protein
VDRDTLGDLDHQGQRPDQSANRDTYWNWVSQIGVDAESSPDTDCMLDAVVASVRIFAPHLAEPIAVSKSALAAGGGWCLSLHALSTTDNLLKSVYSMRMGLAPIVTVEAPARGVVFPFKSCQLEVKPGGMGKVVVPQAALLQGKVVAVLSQANNPLEPVASAFVIVHWNIPVGGEAEQFPPFGLTEQVQSPPKVAPIVHMAT